MLRQRFYLTAGRSAITTKSMARRALAKAKKIPSRVSSLYPTGKQRAKKMGLPPGSALYLGQAPVAPTTLHLSRFEPGKPMESREIRDLEECRELRREGCITWLNVSGVSDVGTIERLGAILNFHPLIVEDIVSTLQRPKSEDYGEYLFLVLRLVKIDENGEFSVSTEQISILVWNDLIVSFEENPTDYLIKVQDRLKGKEQSKILAADYLMYMLMDVVVDNLFTVLEQVGENLEVLEHEVVTEPRPQTLERIYEAKRAMLYVRRVTWPMRELLSSLQRMPHPLIGQEAILFLRDVYDHTIEIMDIVESARDMTSGLIDLYLSSINNGMNSVMKVLTIITTFFMPLSFIAGVYGMNFEHMPELKWHYGYPVVLALMLLLCIAMYFFFKQKEWI